MKLTGNEAREVVHEDHPDWKEEEGTREITDKGRWSYYMTAVFQHKPSGKFYRFYWSCGATEMQDEYPFEYENEYTPNEVHLVEKLVKVWEPV